MYQPNDFYTAQLKQFKSKVRQLKQQLVVLSLIRLVVFGLTAFGVYLAFHNWQLAVAIAVIGVAAFLFALSKYTDVKQQRNLNKALVEINKTELDIASGHFHHRPAGLEYQDPKHFYSLDIDLFGTGSFFQFVNRTNIKEGSETLAKALKANQIDNIALRQQAIKELASKPEWRQLYSATAALIEVEVSAKQIIHGLTHHKPFLPKVMRWLPVVFSGISVGLFVLFLFKVLDVSLLGYWLLLGLFITGGYVKKVNALSANTDRARATFKQYAQLLQQIEEAPFASALLLEKQDGIKGERQKASAIFKQFSRHLDALDNRNNLIGAIFGNGLFLTDVKNSYKIEQWIANHCKTVADWFDVVTFFDAYNSLGNYAFNHPEFVYPTLVNNALCIKAEQLGHPLLDVNKRVDSDLHIDAEQFFIVTGANMAGKSTFLRTVSLHIVMANVGLPVCALKSEYSPIKLITSMRTSDSLTDDSSYFFSELTRLKFIVDAIKTEPYFIILDEILKGTNSTDKAIGSQKFVEKLVQSHATGIIATHDLSLTNIEANLKEVKNYFFDAQIKNDELYFDYKFKKGVCQNMNASFLLKKMEIV